MRSYSELPAEITKLSRSLCASRVLSAGCAHVLALGVFCQLLVFVRVLHRPFRELFFVLQKRLICEETQQVQTKGAQLSFLTFHCSLVSVVNIRAARQEQCNNESAEDNGPASWHDEVIHIP